MYQQNETLSQMLEGKITEGLKITEGPPIYVYPPQNNINYTELGIFISGIILSVGGFLSLILGSVRRSNCKTITCGCIKCFREDLDIQDN